MGVADMKACAVCGELFERHSNALSCSAVCKKKRKLSRDQNAYHRNFEKNRERRNAAMREYMRRNPEKIRARNADQRRKTRLLVLAARAHLKKQEFYYAE